MIRAFLFALFTSFCLAAAAQDGYWQQQMDYDISVSLNDKNHSLDAVEKINYINNSPDTLYFIWFHLWPNAYKNDRTALSDQLLANGRTDFYFSNDEQRGYINRLNFHVNGSVVRTEDHPQHQDIIKVVLNTPLVPGSSCTIETPFHVKLPYNFSRGGHKGNSYQITQWYPKPAVYDRKGWHPMPYLNQGEFYSEFGNYRVSITAPADYVIAATGIENKSEQTKHTQLITAVYQQNNAHDFAWFADKRFAVSTDTLQLPSGKIIQAAVYSVKTNKYQKAWSKALPMIKKAIRKRSSLLGDYPYDNVTVVDADVDYAGGMEYPTITAISGVRTEKELEVLLEHEVGHNWFYAALASNERDHAWMDEGMNTYYGVRYWNKEVDINVRPLVKEKFLQERMPANMNFFTLENVVNERMDQPIDLPSDQYAGINYVASVYYLTSRWLQNLEKTIGKELFDSCIREYYIRWQFKHPYPEDFKKVLQEVSKINLDKNFSFLAGLKMKSVSSNLLGFRQGDFFLNKRVNKVAPFFSFKDTDKYKYTFISPIAGFNLYDKLMIGAAIHNYTLPRESFQYLLAPMYGTASKQLNGVGKLNYHWFTENKIKQIEIGLNASRFSINHSTDTAGKKLTEDFKKFVPYVKFFFKHAPVSSVNSWIDIRSYIINERNFDQYDYIVGSDSSLLYPHAYKNKTRYVNQLSFNLVNNRVLYPYNYQLQLQQGIGFYRINAEGNAFFNYAKGGGVSVRLFAAKFGELGNGSPDNYLYQPKLLAGNGNDDYTYSNYFLGRTASMWYGNIPVNNGGIAAQQVMIQNTGGLKFRLDPYSSVQGYSANWVAAINVSSTLPQKVFPAKIPLKVFFDAGTYAEAWNDENAPSRIFYTGGLQLSLFKNVLNIYAPIIYSKAFKEQLKTDPEANKFLKKITFSIDLSQIKLKKFLPQLVY